MSQRRTPRPREEPGDVLVYVGRTWAGSISRRLGRYRASDTKGNVLGSYETSAAARRAVLDAVPKDGGCT